MKIITTQNELGFQELVGDILDSLQPDTKVNHQKILEVCHAGKLLLHLESFRIAELSEKPDIILTDGKRRVGLEHKIVIDTNSKEREGKFEGIFSQVERELQADDSLPNFLVNCYLMPYVDFQYNQKQALITEMKVVVKHFILTGMLIENTLIDNIFIQPHTQKAVSVNLGAWWQRTITAEIIEEAIQKKEAKVESYIRETGCDQWLLLVIGSTGDSSYEMDQNLDIKLTTKFSKVYLLEDFRNVVYELK